MIMNSLLAAIAMIITIAAPGAFADPITVTFTGTLNESTDPLGNLGGVAPGDSFSGSFTYESTTAPDLSTGAYLDALTAGSFTVDGNAFSLDLTGVNKIEVSDNGALGTLVVDVFRAEGPLTAAFGYDDLMFVLLLVDATLPGGPEPDALDSDALPTAFSLADFPPFPLVDQFVITLAGLHPPEERLRLAGDLTSLVAAVNEPGPGPAPVPEPPTGALILVSLLLMGALAGHRFVPEATK